MFRSRRKPGLPFFRHSRIKRPRQRIRKRPPHDEERIGQPDRVRRVPPRPGLEILHHRRRVLHQNERAGRTGGQVEGGLRLPLQGNGHPLPALPRRRRPRPEAEADRRADFVDHVGREVGERLRKGLQRRPRRVRIARLHEKLECSLEEEEPFGLRRRPGGAQAVRGGDGGGTRPPFLECADIRRRRVQNRLLRRDKLLPRRHRNRRNRAQQAHGQHPFLHASHSPYSASMAAIIRSTRVLICETALRESPNAAATSPIGRSSSTYAR